MKRSTRLLILLCWVLLLLACGGPYSSERVASFSFASTRNIERSYAPIRTNVRGQDCVYPLALFIIPISFRRETWEAAVQDAIRQVPGGDMMVNVSVSRRYVYLGLIAWRCIRVEGDVVDTRSGAR